MRGRVWLLLLVVLILPRPPLQAQDVPLAVKGAGVKDVEQVIQVPKVIIVKVATTFPVTIEAPSGAGLYFWTYPATVQAQDLGDKLLITNAPKGVLPVTVKMITVDWDAKKFITKIGQTSVTVGDVPPGPGPNPPVPPVPPDPVPPQLLADLKAACAKDGHDLAAVKALAGVTQYVTDKVKAQPSALTTVGQVSALYKAEGLNKVGAKLPEVRKVVSAYVNARVPKDVNAKLDEGGLRQTLAETFDTLTLALGRLP